MCDVAYVDLRPVPFPNKASPAEKTMSPKTGCRDELNVLPHAVKRHAQEFQAAAAPELHQFVLRLRKSHEGDAGRPQK